MGSEGKEERLIEGKRMRVMERGMRGKKERLRMISGEGKERGRRRGKMGMETRRMRGTMRLGREEKADKKETESEGKGQC